MRANNTRHRADLAVDFARDRVNPVLALNAFLPATAIVPLRQHRGAPASALVSPGDRVREGMVIGKAEGPGSLSIHAPVPGLVGKLLRTRLEDGSECEAVLIHLEGSFDRLGKRPEKYIWDSMTRKDILLSLKDRGVVETEPPGRPVHELLGALGTDSWLILDALEDEPWLRTEATVLLARPESVAEGLGILARVLEPARVVAFLDAEACIDESRFRDRAGVLLPSIEIRSAKPRFPRSPADQLRAVIGNGKRGEPIRPTLAVRPSTALAVYEAVSLAKPFVERYVTVGGRALKRPAVLKARIGTPIGDLIAECGGFRGTPERLVLGGPLRGTAACNLETPVMKTTTAVLALSAEETRVARSQACIRCGRCADSCPVQLEPDRLLRLLHHGRPDEARAFGLERCTLCGACGYICPSRIPLVQTFASSGAKGEGYP